MILKPDCCNQNCLRNNAEVCQTGSTYQQAEAKCCGCTNIMSHLATDCFAAAGRLQYTLFRTNSVDLNDALLIFIHDYMDAGSRELCIYGRVHMTAVVEILIILGSTVSRRRHTKPHAGTLWHHVQQSHIKSIAEAILHQLGNTLSKVTNSVATSRTSALIPTWSLPHWLLCSRRVLPPT